MMKNIMIIGMLILTLALVGCAKQAMQDDSDGNTIPQVSASDITTITDSDHVKGDADAPVTIIEWSDFECPYCERFYSQTLGDIEKDYIETGKVKFVFRDFPLSFHKNAEKAAEAAECAAEQDMFWEMHDKLYGEGVEGGASTFKGYAEDLGLDTDAFNGCLNSGRTAAGIKSDMELGIAAGVKGTPAFLINGKLVVGAQPYENFKAAIDSELQ